MSDSTPRTQRLDMISYAAMAAALALCIWLHLLPALLAGLLIHELVHAVAPRLFGPHAPARRGRIFVVGLIGVLIIAVVVGVVLVIMSIIKSEGGNSGALLQKMAEIVSTLRERLPESVAESLPQGADALKNAAAAWLTQHAKELRTLGGETLRGIGHVLIGMVLGALVAVREVSHGGTTGPFAAALAERVTRLADAFRRVVFAQVRISALNTTLTAIYLLVVLPLAGVHLPLGKTMVAVTFVVGLLPVLGNLISNSVIVVISLSHSPGVAIASLVFLVVIHKLEYFVNAKIVGTQIHAAAWEILLAMLAMEAAFGIPGVIAAPIFYAYLKRELTEKKLI